MPRFVFAAGLALMLVGCAGKSVPSPTCPIEALPVYDARPQTAAECRPMYDLCAEWRQSAINLCSE